MHKNDEQKYALIYNRVSSAQQETEGSGLISQEHRCVKYAEGKGYIVERNFHDTFTGGGDFMKRPAMRELLEYVDNTPNKSFVVIFDDLKRFARDTKFHIELRGAFNLRKTQVECLNFKFEDTPEGNFVETILAAQNQLEREQNRRQVIQKQKSRLESGFWAFPAPVGYSMQKVYGLGGKIAVPNDKAPFLKEALEGFSNLRFVHLTDMTDFLKQKGVFGERNSCKYIDAVRRLIVNPFYAGFVKYEPWNIKQKKGMHVAIISESTYYKNIERLNNPQYLSRIRRDCNSEFELRGLINCHHCQSPLTACFSKGRKNSYPYYFCQQRNCLLYGKSVARDILDKDFKTAMDTLKPSEDVIKAFRENFEECWREAVANVNKNTDVNADAINLLNAEIEKYTDMAGASKSEVVIARYEQKIEALEKKMKSLKQKSLISRDLSIPHRTALDKVMKTAKDPYKTWDSSELPDKKKLFYFFFDGNILYDVKTGYRTENPSVLYRFLQDFGKESDDVDIVRNLSNQFAEIWQFILKWA